MSLTWAEFSRGVTRFGEALLGSVRDIVPIITVITVFQLFIFRSPLEDVGSLLVGLVLVVLGLTFFLFGLQMGMFPIGESLANDLARKGSLPWLLVFAFALGFGTTVAEPALIAVADKAAVAAVPTTPEGNEAPTAERRRYSMTLRITVALAVGVALIVGVLRILMGWPIHVLILSGYVAALVITMFAPSETIAIAFDSGGVTTSTITVPLATALGVGLAGSIRGRNPLLDGFGLIAFASLTPILFVLILGILW